MLWVAQAAGLNLCSVGLSTGHKEKGFLVSCHFSQLLHSLIFCVSLKDSDREKHHLWLAVTLAPYYTLSASLQTSKAEKAMTISPL